METIKTFHLLEKRTAGRSLMLRWSDEGIIGYGIDRTIAASDLSNRREEAGLPQRPTGTGTHGAMIKGVK